MLYSKDSSNAVAHIVEHRTKKNLVNYLDDYFFAALLAAICNKQVDEFLKVCKEINFPVALEKTFWSTTSLTFLRMLLDSKQQIVCVPIEKIQKAFCLLDKVLNRKSRKVTVLEMQKLCGFLNFLCRCVVPGRVFLRRLYASTQSNKLKPHHHIKITEENRLDMEMWRAFLTCPEAVARPFMDFSRSILTSRDIDMYSDASRNFKLGFGAYCGTAWCMGQWDDSFMQTYQSSIEYLELFAVTVAIIKWLKKI